MKKAMGIVKKILIAVAAVFVLLLVIGIFAGEPEDVPAASDNSGGGGTPVTEYRTTRLYRDSAVSVDFTGIDNDGVHFSVENKTGKEISFVFRTLALDGKSYSDGSGLIYDSTFITAASTGNVTTKLDHEYSTDISRISGTFLYGYSDFSNGDQDGSFRDVPVKPFAVAEYGEYRAEVQSMRAIYNYEGSTAFMVKFLFQNNGAEGRYLLESFDIRAYLDGEELDYISLNDERVETQNAIRAVRGGASLECDMLFALPHSGTVELVISTPTADRAQLAKTTYTYNG